MCAAFEVASLEKGACAVMDIRLGSSIHKERQRRQHHRGGSKLSPLAQNCSNKKRRRRPRCGLQRHGRERANFSLYLSPAKLISRAAGDKPPPATEEEEEEEGLEAESDML